ncbi:MAG: hypothetical protein RLO81_12460 [Fulvivirga sp.]|uniref:hypothetical protein n=1 Tax=Fulvivirga sp. TaxID=1931237 RepID=UPI0032ECD8D8
MKKILLFAILLAPFEIFSQDDIQPNESFKAVSGEKTLELQFVPFGDNPIDINGIRARWFKENGKVFRLNLFLGIQSDTNITQQEDSDLDLEELRDKDFSLTIGVKPGMEKHLKGTERLSPYFGWEGDLTYRTTSFKSEAQNGTDVNYTKFINQDGFIRLGFNAIAGLDVYITKKLYLGTEFGLGASWTKLLNTKVKSDLDGFEEPEPEKRGSSLDFGPNVNAQIRLGYAF